MIDIQDYVNLDSYYVIVCVCAFTLIRAHMSRVEDPSAKRGEL